MGGSVPQAAMAPGSKARKPGAPKVSAPDKPDLSIDGKKLDIKQRGFGLTRLGGSDPFGADPVSRVGETPLRKKKPTIVLLGDQP